MCLFPKKAYQINKGDKLIFSNETPAGAEVIYVNCGKCIECQESYSKEWALRCSLEAKQYLDNCFITLTYASAPNEVCKRDLQLFIKRLRKKLEPLQIKYFACGEYGDLKGRPHYHINIFGWKPKDLYYWSRSKTGNKIYRSPTIEKLWTFGISAIEECDYSTCKYTALYMQKFVDYSDKQKPFVLMSKGLGKNAIRSDMLDTGKVYYGGKYYGIPRYFVKKLSEKLDIDDFTERRRKKAVQKSECISSETYMSRVDRQRKIIAEISSKRSSKKLVDNSFVKEFTLNLNAVRKRREFIRENFKKLLTSDENSATMQTNTNNYSQNLSIVNISTGEIENVESWESL